MTHTRCTRLSRPRETEPLPPSGWQRSPAKRDTTAGGSASPIALPDVKFTGVDLKNRVNTSNFPGLYRYRISGITNEMAD